MRIALPLAHIEPEEARDERRARPVRHVARRARGLDPAAVHQHHVLGERKRLGLVVSDVDRSEAEPVLQDLQLDAHLVAQLRVEVRHRLVEQHQPRLVDQRAGERDALLLAAATVASPACRARRHSPTTSRMRATRSRCSSFGTLAHLERKADVLLDRHVRPHSVGLEHHAELALLRLEVDAARRVERHPAGDRDVALVRRLQSGDAAQDRGLAAAATARAAPACAPRRPTATRRRPRRDRRTAWSGCGWRRRVRVFGRLFIRSRVPGERSERRPRSHDIETPHSARIVRADLAPGEVHRIALTVHAAADLPIAALTRGITCSAISVMERFSSAGSTQSMPA